MQRIKAIMAEIQGFLEEFRGFILLIALCFAVVAAWGGFVELVPTVGKLWTFGVDPLRAGQIGACLAIIAGLARGAPPPPPAS